MMTKQISLDALWDSATSQDRIFHLDNFTHLPEAARRYLEHAIAPGTQLASAVRLWMHGEMKLGKHWHSFKAEEVICRDRGMIWQATTEMNGLPILGEDRIVDGVGNASWNTIQRGGEDITRSCVGRVQAESIWLPSVLCNPDIIWTELSASQVQATFTALGEPAKITLTVSSQGVLEQIKVDRWGSLEGEAFHYSDFGGMVEDSGTFDGYTIPTRLRIGWFFGSERFESEGESFHCTIDNAIYR
jgi:hypothetical protein